MLSLDTVKDLISESLKENIDLLNVVKSENDLNTNEINKLYESVLDLRRQITETNNDQKAVDLKDIPLKIIDIEGNIKSIKSNISSLMGGDLLEVDSSSKNTSLSLKDTVRNLVVGNKTLNDKMDKVQHKLDNFNTELLSKIKKDLMNDSTIILDNFRSDLKSNLSKIEEQMRDKVTKFNMDELIRKFDQKILNEVSRKLDRTDLKRNNNLINKKVNIFL